MILDVGAVPARPRSAKHSWQHQFKMTVYTHNQQVIQAASSSKPHHRGEKRRHAEKALRNLFTVQETRVSDTMTSSGCHSYYSSFIPLQMQTQFDDELTCTFPFLRHLEDCGKTKEKS